MLNPISKRLNGLLRKYSELDTLERSAIMQTIHNAPYSQKVKTIHQCGICTRTYYNWRKAGV